MIEEYSYRVLSVDDLPNIEELFFSAFANRVKTNFFKWKYFENPYGDTILAGAFYKEKLVGSGSMMLEEFNNFGVLEKVYKCTDLMTHPDHQKKGISKAINKLLNEEVLKSNSSFSYTLCSNVSTKSFIKNDWNQVGEISNLFKPLFILKIGSFLSHKKNRTKVFDSIDDLLLNYRFSVFKNKTAINKTSEYIKWRTSNPNFTYKIVCSFDKMNNLNGYLIYSLSKNNLLNIIDFDATFDYRSEIIDTLINETEHIAVKEKYKGILVMAIKGSGLSDLFIKKGYLRNPFKKGPLTTVLDFNIKTYKAVNRQVLDIKSWELSALNYDDI
jgi:hypothetical protein